MNRRNFFSTLLGLFALPVFGRGNAQPYDGQPEITLPLVYPPPVLRMTRAQLDEVIRMLKDVPSDEGPFYGKIVVRPHRGPVALKSR
jgi:hypothetical protein